MQHDAWSSFMTVKLANVLHSLDTWLCSCWTPNIYLLENKWNYFITWSVYACNPVKELFYYVFEKKKEKRKKEEKQGFT